MKEQLVRHIKDYIYNHPKNIHPSTGKRYYDEPDTFFADASDSIFNKFKDVVSPEHMTPKEVFEFEYGEGTFKGGSVIVSVSAIQEDIRASNRIRKDMASKEWALSRGHGDEIFYKDRFREITKYIHGSGYKAVAPWLSDKFKVIRTNTLTSNWSERHMAYAAGAGTFGLSDGFITEKGTCVRIISIVTDMILEPDIRKKQSHTANCLFMSKGLCGVCIKRCPVNAIDKNGHDKMKCVAFVYSKASKEFAAEVGGIEKTGSGCGLCQTKVPCEFRNPMNKQLRKSS
ncbi:MAG: (Fe-S)-binding protein [Deferribacterales bacterium]